MAEGALDRLCDMVLLAPGICWEPLWGHHVTHHMAGSAADPSVWGAQSAERALLELGRALLSQRDHESRGVLQGTGHG